MLLGLSEFQNVSSAGFPFHHEAVPKSNKEKNTHLNEHYMGNLRYSVICIYYHNKRPVDNINLNTVNHLNMT